MRGRVRNISLPRRFIIDLMHASMGVPFVTLSRSVDVRHLIEARMAAGRAPGWAAIFVKAFAIVAKEEPVLRTLYAKWPRPHFYELPRSIAMVAIGRVEDGEDCILPERVLASDEQPLAQIHAQIHRAKRAPVEDIPFFRRIYKATRLPLPLRRFGWWIGRNVGRWHANNFGSFGVTSVAAYGPGELRTIGPGPYVLTYGVVAPDQTVDVVVCWDHRITDAAFIAKALIRLEQVLNADIAAEIRASRPAAEPRPVRSATG
jgi:hypothetical protein